MRKSLSEKELKFISKLELKEQYFFTRDDIIDNFKNKNEMNVYLHRLKKKERIIKLNQNKYFLIPVKAVNNQWAEHPFIIIDEVMNGKDYCIAGKAAAYYHGLIEQIPSEYKIYNKRIHKKMEIFNATLIFRKKRKLPKKEQHKIHGRKFIIATKEEAKKWI